MSPLKACIILDDNYMIPEWQMKAIQLAQDRGQLDIVALLMCTNTRHKKRPIKNFIYYLIRVILMKPPCWKTSDIRSLLANAIPEVPFASEYIGNWQKIPESALDELKGLNLDLSIKFGMGLLKDPDSFPSKFGILSYHHGDPSRFRGRPAALYETYSAAAAVGVVVQKISNKLDGGEMLSIGWFKVYPYSYKTTLDGLYRGSSPLLSVAIGTLIAGRRVDISTDGKNYGLPSNIVGLNFLLVLFWRQLKRLMYGLFYEKKWLVGSCKIPRDFLKSSEIEIKDFKTHELPEGYSFLADCFFSQVEENVFFAEGLRGKSGKGEILRGSIMEPGQFEFVPVAKESLHCSYPFTIRVGEKSTWCPRW